MLTCAIVATTRPKVNAICGIDAVYVESQPPVVLPMPIATRKNVPKNSAISIRHMFRLSVISATPIICFIPVIYECNGKKLEIFYCMFSKKKKTILLNIINVYTWFTYKWFLYQL